MKSKFSSCAFSFAAILLCSFAFIGCTKSNDNPSSGAGAYYINFKADGVQKQYSSDAEMAITYDADQKIYVCLMGAYKQFDPNMQDSSQESLSLLLFNNSTIVSGTTFQDPNKITQADGTQIGQLQITYYDDQKQGYATLGLFTDSTGAFPGFPNVIADGKVTISELTSSYAKGTFSGTTYWDKDLKTTHVITDGQFYVKRTN